MTTLGRAYQLIFAVALSLGVLSPLDPDFRRVGDDFPFSFYPMFAGSRPKLERPTYAVAISADDSEHYIPTGWWTTGGFNEGRTQLAKAVKAGPEASLRYCELIASRLAQRRSLPSVVRVEIRQAAIDRAAWFTQGKVATNAQRRQMCPVVR